MSLPQPGSPGETVRGQKWRYVQHAERGHGDQPGPVSERSVLV